MLLTWQETLEHLGYLHQDQLARYFSLTPDDIHPDASTIWYRDALWHARLFGQGRHRAHRHLVTESILALAPLCQSFTLPGHDGLVVADAVLTMTDIAEPVWLEADTGKENAQQWQEKLAGYVLESHVRLLVVAGGKSLRLQRLTAWLQESSPHPWTLIPLSTLSPHQSPDLLWQIAAHPTVKSAIAPATPPQEIFTFKGQPMPKEWARAALDAGELVEDGRDIRHQSLVVYLKKAKS